MADLRLMPNPHGAPEMDTISRIDRVGRLVRKAEALLAQPVHNPDEIKALAAEMEEFGLKRWAKQLRDIL